MCGVCNEIGSGVCSMVGLVEGSTNGSLEMGTGVLYASKSSILNVEVIP